MLIPEEGLNFDDAREVYSAFLKGAKGKPQEMAFGELSLANRRAVVKAIDVLKQNKPALLANRGFADLLSSLEQSKALTIAGRAEVVLANRFLFPTAIFNALEPKKGTEGEIYKQLEAVFDDTTIPGRDKKKAVFEVLEKWVKGLDEGGGKQAAKDALKTTQRKMGPYDQTFGFVKNNLPYLARTFRTEFDRNLTSLWGKESLSRADKQAMGIGFLGSGDFFAGGKLAEKKRDFEGLQNTETPDLSKIETLEAELMPHIRQPEFALLYSKVLGLHASQLWQQAREHALLTAGRPETAEEKETLTELVGKTLELAKLQSLYAGYAASEGQAEGLLDVGRWWLMYGSWSSENISETRDQVLSYIERAEQLADIADQNEASRINIAARLLRADCYAKQYHALRPIPETSEAALESAKKAQNIYALFGMKGVSGLYDLFLGAGLSADPMMKALQAKFSARKPPMPTDEELEMITVAAMTGDEKATALLEKLNATYPTSKTRAAEYLVNVGTYTEVISGGHFTIRDAENYYQKAIAHLRYAASHLENDDQTNIWQKKNDDLQKKFRAFERSMGREVPEEIERPRSFAVAPLPVTDATAESVIEKSSLPTFIFKTLQNWFLNLYQGARAIFPSKGAVEELNLPEINLFSGKEDLLKLSEGTPSQDKLVAEILADPVLPLTEDEATEMASYAVAPPAVEQNIANLISWWDSLSEEGQGAFEILLQDAVNNKGNLENHPLLEGERMQNVFSQLKELSNSGREEVAAALAKHLYVNEGMQMQAKQGWSELYALYNEQTLDEPVRDILIDFSNWWDNLKSSDQIGFEALLRDASVNLKSVQEDNHHYKNLQFQTLLQRLRYLSNEELVRVTESMARKMSLNPNFRASAIKGWSALAKGE